MVHQVAGGELGDVLHLDGAGPVPVVAPPGFVAGPVGKQHLAQVTHAVGAGPEDLAVAALVTAGQDGVEEVEDEDHVAAGGVLPGHVLGIGVSRPGRPAGVARTFLGQQIGPVPRRLQPAGVAGQLGGTNQCQAALGHDVQLHEASRIRLAVGLPGGGGSDQKPGPGMVVGRLAEIQQGVGLQREVSNGGGVAAVAVVIHQAGQNVGGTLHEIAVGPVLDRRHGDLAFSRDVPGAAEHVLGRGGGRPGPVGPGVSLHGFGGDADAVVELAVGSGIPRRDHAVGVVYRRIGVVSLTGRRGRKRSAGRQQ